MSVIITDTGFSSEHPPVLYVPLTAVDSHEGAVDLENTDDPALLAPYLADLRLVRIAFPSFSDGRGLTLARRLRMMGYTGTLRANGQVMADQYAMVRRVGFDEVEIPDDLAERQPEPQWLFRADWQAHYYQAQLKA